MKSSSHDIIIAREISGYIRTHLDQPLTLPDICRKFAISDFTLKRLFRKVYRKTVHQYILEKRLQKARRLLLTTNLTIKQIRGLTGFSRVSSFSYAFRKCFGYPPATLRKWKRK